MKPLRNSIFETAARNEATHDHDDVWKHAPLTRYQRSYGALSDALHDIFQEIYIRESFVTAHQTTNKTAPLTYEDVSRLRTLQSRFVVVLKDDPEEGCLEIEICPTNDLRIAQPYNDSHAVMRGALHDFYNDLNEIAAGIPGVRVDPLSHCVTVTGPKPLYDMIEALCETKDILTFENFHESYVSYHTPNDDEPEPGHNEYLPAPQKPVYDDDVKAGTRFRRLAGNKHVTADIPHEAFATMAAQPYSFREIGSLINHYNNRSVYPLLSLQALEAVTKQDMNGGATLKDTPGYNLH